MRVKSTHFVEQYNDLNAWKNRNKPLERINPARILNNPLKIPLGKLPLTKGKVHFIRKVDNDGKISVLNEAFKVGEEFIGEYAWATICLEKQTMEVFYRAKDPDAVVLIKKFEYELSEVVQDIRQDICKIL